MEIKLDSDAVTSIASAAIFDSLSQEARDSVVKQAIQGLMTPDRNAMYGRSTTPLQDAFDSAVREAAHKIVREKIASDPQVVAAIDDLLGPLLKAALEGEGTQYRTELADALGNALAQWLADKARGE